MRDNRQGAIPGHLVSIKIYNSFLTLILVNSLSPAFNESHLLSAGWGNKDSGNTRTVKKLHSTDLAARRRRRPLRRNVWYVLRELP